MSQSTNGGDEPVIVSRTTVHLPDTKRQVERLADEWLADHEPVENRSAYYQSDEYSHSILPLLRQYAGFEDKGDGQFERMTKVEVRDFGGTREMDSSCVLSELSEHFIDIVTE